MKNEVFMTLSNLYLLLDMKNKLTMAHYSSDLNGKSNIRVLDKLTIWIMLAIKKYEIHCRSGSITKSSSDVARINK